MFILKLCRFTFFWGLILICSCETTEPCASFDVSIELRDTRTGRQEGTAKIISGNEDGYDYVWDTGKSGVEIVDLKAGEYCVTITSRAIPNCNEVLCGIVESFEAIGSRPVDDGITKILFIGNSHTFFYQLPEKVTDILSNTLTQPLMIESATKPGFKLQDHTESIETDDLIKSANWDYVVLQENATVASLTKSRADFAIYPFAEILKEKIVDNNAMTNIVLYMTHAYEDGLEDCESSPTTCTGALMQDEIRRNYIELEDLLDADVAPAGIIWEVVLSKNIPLMLWDVDKIHPSRQGSLVSAATIAAILADVELKSEDIDDTILGANETQQVVDIINNALFKGEPDWRTF